MSVDSSRLGFCGYQINCLFRQLLLKLKFFCRNEQYYRFGDLCHVLPPQSMCISHHTMFYSESEMKNFLYIYLRLQVHLRAVSMSQERIKYNRQKNIKQSKSILKMHYWATSVLASLMLCFPPCNMARYQSNCFLFGGCPSPGHCQFVSEVPVVPDLPWTCFVL